MERANKELAKKGIKVRTFTADLEESAIHMNREDCYTIRAALRQGLQAPFLHILGAFWMVTFWKALTWDLPIAFVVGYLLAGGIFLIITHILVTTKLTSYGHIGEVHAIERGVLLVAMDITQEPQYLVGMVGVNPLSETLAEIVRFVVRTPYRGRRIGSGLLESAFHFAVEEGYMAIEAETWDVATDFELFPMYAKHGFHRHSATWAPYSWMPMYRAEILIKDLK